MILKGENRVGDLIEECNFLKQRVYVYSVDSELFETVVQNPPPPHTL